MVKKIGCLKELEQKQEFLQSSLNPHLTDIDLLNPQILEFKAEILDIQDFKNELKKEEQTLIQKQNSLKILKHEQLLMLDTKNDPNRVILIYNLEKENKIA